MSRWAFIASDKVSLLCFTYILTSNWLVRGHEFGSDRSIANKRLRASEALFNLHGASSSVSKLMQLQQLGDVDAASELSLAFLLGSGVDQDLRLAAEESTRLLLAENGRARTTHALMLSHNLTASLLNDEERAAVALSHYKQAALRGDPLAQLIVGKHYFNNNECGLALELYREVALHSLNNVDEMTVSHLNMVAYIRPEDDPFKAVGLPSKEEFEFIENMARYGDPNSALKAAVLHISDTPGIPKDYFKAAEFLEMAVDANVTKAMVILAGLHLANALEPDYELVLNLLQTALEYGDETAHTEMGKMYMEGHGRIQKDLTKAVFHFEKGAAIGDIEAIYLLGKVYAGPDDIGTAAQAADMWFIPAAVGHVYSAWNLAEYYRQSLQKSALEPTSALSEKVCEKAVPLYRLVSLSGEWRNLHEAAYADYQQGQKRAAYMKYLLLSDLGYAGAHVNAGHVLDEVSGEIYNSSAVAAKESLQIWTRAATAGMTLGHVRVGDCYYYGVGVKQNKTAAVGHYEMAASLKNPHGTFSLAQMVEWGEGTEQDLERARGLYGTVGDLEEDGALAVTLTLARMDLFMAVNKTLRFDLYRVEWTWQNMQRIALRCVPPWDVIIMMHLLVFITVASTYKFLRN